MWRRTPERRAKRSAAVHGYSNNLQRSLPMAKLEKSPAVRLVGCVLLLLFAAPLWISCLMISALTLKPREQQTAAMGWPEVPCRIQKLSVEQHTLSSGKGRTSPAYSPKVEFEYEFDGHPYRSERFWLGGTLFGTHEEVVAIIAPYQEGAAAACYVDPKAPQDAVLSRTLYDEDSLGWMWLVVFGLVGAVGCTAGMWMIFFPRGCRSRQGDWVPASRGEVLFGWLAALSWNGLFSTLFILVCLRRPPPSQVVDLFVFPFLGLLFALGATLKTLQYRRTSKAATSRPAATKRKPLRSR